MSLGLFASALWAGAASAQVGISPLVVEVEAERGRAQGVITVTNDSDEEFRARVYMEPFTYDQEDGFQSLETAPEDLSSYLRFSPIELEVPADESRKIRFVAQLPPSLAEGEYRGVLFTETLVETINEEGVRVVLKTRVGATIYVRHGDLSPELTVDRAFVDIEDNQLELLVNNTGPASSRPRVDWQLMQADTEVATGVTEPFAVLAEGSRHLPLGDFDETFATLSPGQYQLTGDLIWAEDEEWETLPFELDVTIPSTVSRAN
ncbi:MAG: P pilus assembly protein, chaperone PapD [Cyanobacteria bacterium P01_H01_bin.105]